MLPAENFLPFDSAHKEKHYHAIRRCWCGQIGSENDDLLIAWLQAHCVWVGCRSAKTWLSLRTKFHANAAVADEAIELIENWFAAHMKFLHRAVGISAAEYKIQKRLLGGNTGL